MNHASLCSGIGGFDLAAQWCGWNNVFQVEIDKYCRKVLEKNFPNAKRYKDIKEFDGTKYAGTIDVLSAGFPCQPFSVAGKREGANDDRHIWPEALRVIREIKPPYVVLENVTGLVSMEDGRILEQILVSLENEGYKTESLVLPACSKGAPHRRYRIFIIAYFDKFNGNIRRPDTGKIPQQQTSEIFGNNKTTPDYSVKHDGQFVGEQEERQIQQHRKCVIQDATADTNGFGWKNRVSGKKQEGQTNECGNEVTLHNQFNFRWYEVASLFCGMDDGIPDWLHGNRTSRIKALGNAIVPQLAYEIFKCITTVNDQKV